MNKALEQALGKVLRLSEAEQDVAAELLEQLAVGSSGPYELTDSERSIVDAALQRARSGAFASDAEVEAALRRPWRG